MGIRLAITDIALTGEQVESLHKYNIGTFKSGARKIEMALMTNGSGVVHRAVAPRISRRPSKYI